MFIITDIPGLYILFVKQLSKNNIYRCLGAISLTSVNFSRSLILSLVCRKRWRNN